MCGRLRLPRRAYRHVVLGCCLWLVLAGDQVRSLPRCVWESVLEAGGHHPTEVAWLTRQCSLPEPLVPTIALELFEFFSNHLFELEPRYGIEP